MKGYAMKPSANPTGGKMNLSVNKNISPTGRSQTSPDLAAGRSKGRKNGGR